jgi:signal peptidase II
MLDQISKYYIKSNMDIGESFNFIKNILNIRYIENPGASFGMLADHRWVFMTFSTIALIFMFAAVFYLNKKSLKKYNIMPNIALAFMLGGGIGNMIDRVFNVSERREGVKVVVDFLEFDFVDFAIFNFADTFITLGSVLFCICVFLGKYKFSDKSKSEEFEESVDIDEIIEEFLEDSGDDIS